MYWPQACATTVAAGIVASGVAVGGIVAVAIAVAVAVAVAVAGPVLVEPVDTPHAEPNRPMRTINSSEIPYGGRRRRMVNVLFRRK
jgi:hypothetical protein